MSQRREIIEALQIVEKYDPNGRCDAQHDVLFLSPHIENLSHEDRQRLEELGAYFDEEYDSWCMYT